MFEGIVKTKSNEGINENKNEEKKGFDDKNSSLEMLKDKINENNL